MKTKFIIILLSLFSFNNIEAQFLLSPRCIVNPDPNSLDCTSEIVVEGLNVPAGGTIFWWSNVTNTSTETFLGDTILTFCYSDDELVFVFNSDTIYGTNAIIPQFKFQVTAYSAPSSMVTPDGYLEITFDSVQPAINANYIDNLGETIDYPAPTTTDNKTFVFTNLYYGVFGLWGQPVGITGYVENTMILLGDITTQLPNYNLNVEVSITDTDPNCTGSILLTPTNAVGNVVYTWGNDSSISGPFQDDLCAGTYSVYAIDANQQQALIHVTVVDTSNANIYSDSTVDIYTAGDTIYYDFLNCDIDYNLPVDSVDYIETLVSSTSANPLVYSFTLNVYQGANTYIFTSTLFVEQDSNIFLGIAIYCEQLKALFTGHRINLIRHGAISTSASIIENENENSMKIYPNPSEDKLKIEGEFSNGTLIDVNGRIVMTIQSNEISMASLKSGLYFLKFDEYSKVYKVRKK